MPDLSILDLSLAKMQDEVIDPADVPALIEAEEAGKTRKGVVAYLKGLLPLSEAVSEPEAPSEPEDAAPVAINRGDMPEIECAIHNVHLGDGRQLAQGERANVRADIAELLVGNKQAVYV